MRAALMFGLLSVISCAASTAAVEPRASEQPYEKAAARFYTDLAHQLESGGQSIAAARMQEKHGMATAGETILPDYPTPALRKRLSTADRKALLASHVQLIKLLTPAALERQPELSAQAVTFYDCRLAEMNDRTHGDAAGCDEGYLRALAALESFPPDDAVGVRPVPIEDLADEDHVEAPEAEPAAAPAVAETPPAAESAITVTYIVPFDWNSAALNREAQNVLEDAMTDMHNIDSYDVVLNGHTDLSGSATANMALSMKRVETVFVRLRKSGVPGEKIATYAFGDTDPKEKTAVGQRSARNRRVEIVIG